MATVAAPIPNVKAKYAMVYDEEATIAQVHGILYVVYADRIERFAIEAAPFTVILGDCQLADDQALCDRIAGGAARIACRREEGVN